MRLLRLLLFANIRILTLRKCTLLRLPCAGHGGRNAVSEHLVSSSLTPLFCPLPTEVIAANGAPVDSDSDRVDLHSSSDSSYVGKSGIIEDSSSGEDHVSIDEDHSDVDFEGRSARLESAPLVGARSAALCPAAPSLVDCNQILEHRSETRKFLMAKRQRRK